MQVAHAAGDALCSIWPRRRRNQGFGQWNVLFLESVPLQVLHQVVVSVELATAPLAGDQL